MDISIWEKTSGTWINAASVLVGTLIGLGVRQRFSPAMQQTAQQAIGLLTLFLGVHMAASMTQVTAGPVDGVILGLGALALGGVLGEWLQLDARLARLGGRLARRQRGTNTTTEGTIAAFLLFCIGPLTLLGSLSNGLTGNPQLLLIKAALDGTAAIALTWSFGASVGVSVLPLVVVQAGMSLTAGLLTSVIAHPETDPAILLMSGIGGLLLIGLALALLDVTRIRIAALLPALALGPLLYLLANQVFAR
jgi:uncharacterized membrane protein YqgA involved in biofilm formation